MEGVLTACKSMRFEQYSLLEGWTRVVAARPQEKVQYALPGGNMTAKIPNALWSGTFQNLY